MLKKITTLLLAFMMILIVCVPASLAVGEDDLEIEYVVLISNQGKYVMIKLDDYIDIYFSKKGAIFNILKDENDEMDVYAVVSNQNVFIHLDNYIDAFFIDPQNALNPQEVEELDANIVNTIYKVVSYNDENDKIELELIKSPIDFQVVDIF